MANTKELILFNDTKGFSNFVADKYELDNENATLYISLHKNHECSINIRDYHIIVGVERTNLLFLEYIHTLSKLDKILLGIDL